MPRYLALKEIPNGVQPGQEFEANEDQGNVLVLVGAARLADETKDQKPRARGGYNRRDMVAAAHAVAEPQLSKSATDED